MLKVITMTAYRRPAYTREVLKALSECKGIEDWLFLPVIEPGCSETIEAFDTWDFSDGIITTNHRRLGLNANTHLALYKANQMKPDILVHIEDDTVPSPDALLYFEFAVQEILKQDHLHRILLASGYNKPEVKPAASESHRFETDRPVWTPWGWAVDRSRLEWLLAHWSFRNPKCFTCNFKKKYRNTRLEVYPLLSRIQNIGYEKGENERTPQWYRDNHRTPFVATKAHLRKQWAYSPR